MLIISQMLCISIFIQKEQPIHNGMVLVAITVSFSLDQTRAKTQHLPVGELHSSLIEQVCQPAEYT